MPLSSLKDPPCSGTGRFEGGMVRSRASIPDALEQRQRTRLAYIGAALVAAVEDEDDLKRKVLDLYWQSALGMGPGGKRDKAPSVPAAPNRQVGQENQ
ncbi:hypothetical protein [Bosea sp. NBC_00550]|uniref:hypothetical protein n=1 Tax=Bosea sp. NBC_00550 TaxID=2969621 RepID=UPI00222FB7FD|nr:hypothetical protein [Bosea sp. NBC_00550]UZF95669.1 hypothetical protein NWE53_27090 [Bosea sp. NBC_00550]